MQLKFSAYTYFNTGCNTAIMLLLRRNHFISISLRSFTGAKIKTDPPLYFHKYFFSIKDVQHYPLQRKGAKRIAGGVPLICKMPIEPAKQ